MHEQYKSVSQAALR